MGYIEVLTGARVDRIDRTNLACVAALNRAIGQNVNKGARRAQSYPNPGSFARYLLHRVSHQCTRATDNEERKADARKPRIMNNSFHSSSC